MVANLMRTSTSRDELVEAFEQSRLDELDELHRAYRPNRYRSLLLTWLGGWFRTARRAVAEPLPAVLDGEVGISYAGHATVLVRYPGFSIVCDPMLGARIGMIRRAEQAGLGPDQLREVDLVLITHSHKDHLHRPTLKKLPRSATVVVPPSCAELVSRLGFARVLELGVGQSMQHGGVDIVSAPVRHESRDGRSACSYVLRGNGPSVYFCGDSGYFSGFSEVGRRYRPDIAILPIAGYLPKSFRARHMSPLDAIYAFEDLGARMLIPIHHGAFTLSYEHLEEPLAWLRQILADQELQRYATIMPAGASRKFR